MRILQKIFTFFQQKLHHIFPTKNNSAFVIFTFKILTKTLINNMVNFEQPAPGLQQSSGNFQFKLYKFEN